MKRYELDIEKSKEVFDCCKKHLQIKMCYNNIFEVVTDFNSKFRSGEFKVAYGYMSVMANLYCRHCFVIDNNGAVIDPTIFLQSNPNEQREYFAIKIFDDVDVYIDAIENENYMPALEKYLKEETKQAYEWANNKGYILIG